MNTTAAEVVSQVSAVTSASVGNATRKTFPPTDVTNDVVVPLSVIIGLLVINVLVLLFIFRLKKRQPSNHEVLREMEELGKILPGGDEKLGMNADRI